MKQFMKRPIRRPTGRQLFWTVTGVVCLLLAGILALLSAGIRNSQPSQRMAQRWDEEGHSAHVSCFFSDSAQATPDTVMAFEYALKNKLQEASIEAPSESARLWVDAYSAKGQISLSSGLSSVNVGAYGVGGDYFMFHPLELEPGSMYFSGDDMMQDKVLLDQNTAWQLFGSYDIAGQPITIGSGSDAHVGVVAGVIKNESGWMNEKAGASAGTVYVSYEMLDTYGRHSGINVYEIVMPNPITGFAKGMVADNMGFEEEQIQVVENSSRFSFLGLLSVIGQFGTRSMNAKAIIYPYWENAARGWEDILSILLVLELLFLLVPVILLIILIRKLWKGRTFHFSDVKNWLADRQEAHWARQAARAERKGPEKQKALKKKTEKKASAEEISSEEALRSQMEAELSRQIASMEQETAEEKVTGQTDLFKKEGRE